jgi:hypothetical protein
MVAPVEDIIDRQQQVRLGQAQIISSNIVPEPGRIPARHRPTGCLGGLQSSISIREPTRIRIRGQPGLTGYNQKNLWEFNHRI